MGRRCRPPWLRHVLVARREERQQGAVLPALDGTPRGRPGLLDLGVGHRPGGRGAPVVVRPGRSSECDGGGAPAAHDGERRRRGGRGPAPAGRAGRRRRTWRRGGRPRGGPRRTSPPPGSSPCRLQRGGVLVLPSSGRQVTGETREGRPARAAQPWTSSASVAHATTGVVQASTHHGVTPSGRFWRTASAVPKPSPCSGVMSRYWLTYSSLVRSIAGAARATSWACTTSTSRRTVRR